jgi:hypothetical protein
MMIPQKQQRFTFSVVSKWDGWGSKTPSNNKQQQQQLLTKFFANEDQVRRGRF